MKRDNLILIPAHKATDDDVVRAWCAEMMATHDGRAGLLLDNRRADVEQGRDEGPAVFIDRCGERMAPTWEDHDDYAARMMARHDTPGAMLLDVETGRETEYRAMVSDDEVSAERGDTHDAVRCRAPDAGSITLASMAAVATAVSRYGVVDRDKWLEAMADVEHYVDKIRAAIDK